MVSPLSSRSAWPSAWATASAHFASGVPSTNALTYAGLLEDGTGPVNGSHNIQVIFYDAATAGNNLCQSTTAPLQIVDGHFSVLLPDLCTTKVGGATGSPNVWVDVLVDGSDTGRTKIGAVPYAIEANHATNADNATTAATANAAGGPLATTISTAQSNIATLQTEVSTLQSNVTTLLARVDLKVFAKGGNNGSVSCDTFCAGSQWGTVGTCVGSDLNGAFIPCATNLGITTATVGMCWCSAP